MEHIKIILLLLIFYSAAAMSASKPVHEEHPSIEACRAAISQYAQDIQTWMRHEKKFVKILKVSEDQIIVERDDSKEYLKCQGTTSIYRLEEK